MKLFLIFLQPGTSECNLGKFLKELALFINESEQFCLRAKNRIPADKDLNLNQEVGCISVNVYCKN